jgi:hypothetical protein
MNGIRVKNSIYWINTHGLEGDISVVYYLFLRLGAPSNKLTSKFIPILSTKRRRFIRKNASRFVISERTRERTITQKILRSNPLKKE